MESAIPTRTVHGYSVPAAVSDPAFDYEVLAQEPAFLIAPWERRVDVIGPDAASFLHQLLTQDIRTMSVGDSRPAAQADRTGHLQAELRVFRADEETIHVRVGSPYVSEFVATLEKHIIMEDVELRMPFDEPAAVLFFGDFRAEEALRELGGTSMPVHEVGPDDRVCFLNSTSLPALRKAMEEISAREIGWDAFNRRRIECGRAWPGLDVGPERLVPEAGYEDHISYNKGCYLGQETLARLHYRGRPNWQLVRLQMDGEDLPSNDTDLLDASGERVGWITSSASTPTASTPTASTPTPTAVVALGYLHRRFRETPTNLTTPSGRTVTWIPDSQ